MLCLIAEIAMTIFGIITLVKGKFSLTKNRVVKGIPAYAIGIILTATFPVLFCGGLFIGIVMAILAHGRQPDVQKLKMAGFFLEIGLVLVISLVVLVIACLSSKKTE
jgi:F0F1-type ATP synthase membrane subunit c/vacuolar-type H+-ATPase subunit K